MAETTRETTRVVGKSFPKRDARLKAAGKARYAGDIRLGGQSTLCGKILRSLHPHATIVSIDVTRAAALPGVYAVVTGQDATPERIGRFVRDRTVLARDKVRHIGEPVAAVAAIDEATALQALALIDVEYSPLPPIFDPEAALSDGAPVVHEDLAGYHDAMPTQRHGNQRNQAAVQRGDVEAAFARADVVVEDTFQTQRVHQGFIDAKACVAEVDESGKVNIWTGGKGPFLVRSMTALGLGLPISKVKVQSATIGGDFGGKGAPTIEPICALLAMKAGRPVKIALNSQEELATNFVRHPATIKLRLAADRDGKLLGLDGHILFDCGAYCDGAGGMANSCSSLQGSYNIPAVHLSGQSAFTNNMPAGHVRAPGAPQTIFAIETLMDKLARQLQMDPLAIRRLNALREGDPAPGARGQMGGSGLLETIDKVADYKSQRMAQRLPNQGIGVACGAWHTGAGGEPNITKCVIKVNEDGSVTLLTGLADNGAGQHIVLAQVAAEVLGLAPDEVAVVAADTDATPYDNGPGGSRGTTRVSLATRFAAEDVRRQLFALAATKLEANAEDLEIDDRRIHVKGSPDKALPIATLAAMSANSPRGAIIGVGSDEHEEYIAEVRQYIGIVDEASFCTHAARVEVDPETGQVKVLQYVAAQDTGKALNPINAMGQIHGAVAGGLGYALGEQLMVEEGRVLNANFADYHMPLADITPNIEPIIVEHPSTVGPYGARGIGETSITPVAAVIANAIYDAVGVRITTLPITPEKVLRALKEKGQA